jgi:hypothetical protein
VRPTRAGTELARRAVVAVEDADAEYFARVPARARPHLLSALKELGGKRG